MSVGGGGEGENGGAGMEVDASALEQQEEPRSTTRSAIEAEMDQMVAQNKNLLVLFILELKKV